jgi:Ribbon-helix-helix protein, copG family
MRTTLRIDDDLMRDLRNEARREKTSLTELVNRVIRRGLDTFREVERPRRRYREKTFSMGPPRVDLTKAMALAARLEDEETIRKLGLHR